MGDPGFTIDTPKFLVNFNVSEIKEKELADGKKEYTVEIGVLQGHSVKPLKITVTDTKGKGVEWAKNELENKLSTLNEATKGNFEKIFSGNKQDRLEIKKSLNKLTSPSLKGQIKQAISHLFQSVWGKTKQKSPDLLTNRQSFAPQADSQSFAPKADRQSFAPQAEPISQKKSVRPASTQQAAQKPDPSQPWQAAQPQIASTGDKDLDRIKSIITQANKNTNSRIKLELVTNQSGQVIDKNLEVEKIAFSSKKLGSVGQSGAQTKALTFILKKIADKTNENNLPAIIPLYQEVTSLRGFNEKLGKNPELKILNDSVSTLIKLSGIELTKQELEPFINDFNQLSAALKTKPELNTPETKSVATALSKVLVEKMCGLGAIPQRESIDNYIELIAKNGAETSMGKDGVQNSVQVPKWREVKESLIWGHQNNANTRNLIPEIAKKVPFSSPEENKNVLLFLQEYVDANASLPFKVKEREACLNTINEIALRMEEFPEEASNLSRAVEEKLGELLNSPAPPTQNETNLPIEQMEQPEPYPFDSLSPEQIYWQLAALNEQAFLAIDLSHLDNLAWSKNLLTSLTEIINLTNQTQVYLVSQILLKGVSPTATNEEIQKLPQDFRQENAVNAIKKIIAVLDFAMNQTEELNLSVIMTLSATLGDSAVDRLLKEEALGSSLTEAEKGTLEKLKELGSTENSSQNSRLATNSALLNGEKVVPFVGTTLSDLTFSYDGNPQEIDGQINMSAAQLMASQKKRLQLLQGSISMKAPPEGIQEQQQQLELLKENMQYMHAVSSADKDLFYSQSLIVSPRKPKPAQ